MAKKRVIKQANGQVAKGSTRTVLPKKDAIRKLALNPKARGPNAEEGGKFDVDETGRKKDNPEAVQDFAEYLGVAVPTTRKLLNGEGVYPSTIQDVAKTLDCSVIDIVNFKDIELPYDPAWYTRLNLAFYIDNNRQTVGKPSWYFERIALKRDSDTLGMGLCSFSGTIRNQFDNEFDVKAFLMDRHLFTMICTPRKKEWQLSFTASFTRRIKLKGVVEGKTFEALEGQWSGIDHVGRNAVYRMVLTKFGVGECLKQEELKPLRVHSRARRGYSLEKVPGIAKVMRTIAETEVNSSGQE